jgi:tetratricopeptide (TPR) repeat protein
MKSEWTMSIADYTDAIHNQSDYAYAYARRGSVQNILGNFTAALRDLNEALRLEPHDTGALVDRGYAHDLSGDVSNAIADFDKAVALEPKESHAYAFRGYAWFRSGDFEAAIRDLDHATQLEPDDPEAWNLLAWFRATCASEKFRDGSEALTAATKACELSHWKEPCYIDTLAAAHAENGIFELAVKCEQQALSCHPPCKALSREMQERLTLYEQHQPYREASKQSQRPTTPILP